MCVCVCVCVFMCVLQPQYSRGHLVASLLDDPLPAKVKKIILNSRLDPPTSRPGKAACIVDPDPAVCNTAVPHPCGRKNPAQANPF